MKSHSLTLALSCVFMFAGSSQAQVTDPADVTSVFEIEFKGGTVAEYLELLRSKPSFCNEGHPDPLNIVAGRRAAMIRLPEIKLTTNMTGAIGLLKGYKTDNGTLEVDSDPTGNLLRVQATQTEPEEVTVISCRDLLKRMEIQELLEAINFGLELQGSTVELKLHEKTGLLFARGTPASTKLVRETIEQLWFAVQHKKGQGDGSSANR